MPVTYLKIDVDFVRGLGSNPANQHLVKAMVGLAEGFGCKTIAEGVEDAQTLALLTNYGVHFAQGSASDVRHRSSRPSGNTVS